MPRYHWDLSRDPNLENYSSLISPKSASSGRFRGLEAAEQLGRGKKPDLMSLLGGIGKLAEEFIEPAPLGEVLKSRDDYWVQQLPMLLSSSTSHSRLAV